MKTRHIFLIARIFIGTWLLLTDFIGVIAQQPSVPFDSTGWEIVKGKVSEVSGKQAYSGAAFLKNCSMENGTIEFNMLVTGQRGYPGLMFRMAVPGDYERVYLRPHLPSYFQNVVQYCGTFNDIDAWQLYSGKGYTASAEIVKNEWFHVKVEISGSQARVFLNDQPKPALHIRQLAHGKRAGGIGVSCADDGSAWFADFSWKTDNSLDFPPETREHLPYGVVDNWQISRVFKMNEADNERMPGDQGLNDLHWIAATCRGDGIVDISRYYPRTGNLPDIIFAKAILEEKSDTAKMFSFGYSDMISVFLNGKLLFAGNSAYTSRDPSFQGIVGLNDYIVLPLKKGRNELMIALTENFGGWGFIFRDAKAVYMDKNMEKKWEMKSGFAIPESAEYDKKRNVIYVSNYYNDGKEYIAKISPDGQMIRKDWVTGIMQPTGLCMSNDRLYVVGRLALIEIDPESGTILNRFRFPSPGMPNDVTADGQGNLYITDTQRSLIYRFNDGKIEEWLTSPKFNKPNGILFDQNVLLVGNSSDGDINRVNPMTREITHFTTLSNNALIDGIAKDNHGGYIVSDFNGMVYRIKHTGEQMLILDTTAPEQNQADFVYIPEKELLVVPNFGMNMLTSYRIRSY